ncbi:MAG: hypothetical protein HOP33_02565 [Verrucomicrobia bacterium]|nr:hypothetical protein [Verrucomicrobiota bacterium]
MSNPPNSINPKTQEEFAFVVTNFLMQTTNIQASNRTCRSALKAAEPQLAAQDRHNLVELSGHPAVGDMVNGLVQKPGSEIFETIAKGITENSLKGAMRNVDAAAIVFSHSLLDATLYTFCSLCHRVSPTDWLEFIGERKVKVSDLQVRTKADLLFEKSKSYLDELERESLSVKANTLHALCKPPPSPGYIKNYSYSSEGLEKFDTTRIGIVHAMQFKSPIQGVDAMLDFSQATGLYFAVMIARKYGLQMVAGNSFWNRLRAELA